MKKTTLNLALALALVFCISATANAAWQPKRDVEFINPSAAGGGSDLNARTIAELAKKHGFCPTNIVVNYKTGGSGAVGFAYMASKKGNDHTIFVLHNGHDLASYVLDWDVKAKDLTYLGTVAEDALMLCAMTDAPYKNVQELIETARERRVTCGGASRGTADELCMLMFNAETGSKLEYVNFTSSGENVTAMLGGHVELGVLNPSECIAQVRAGKIRPLVTFSPTREPGEFADVPTMAELGYPNASNVDSRAVAGPPDMPQEAVLFYQEMLRKITETEEWQEVYLKRNFLRPIFLDGQQSREARLKWTSEAMKRFEAAGIGKKK